MRRHLYVLIPVFSLLALPSAAGTPQLQTSTEAARTYDLATREAQHRALLAMPQIDAEYGSYGRLRKAEGRTGIYLPGIKTLQKGDNASGLLKRLSGLLMASGSESLVIEVSGPTPIGRGYFAFADQAIQGIPVIDARVNVVVSDDGEIQTINSLFVPQGGASSTPDLSAQAAKAKLQQQLTDMQASVVLQTDGSLAFWTNDGEERIPRLLWMFNGVYTKDGSSQLMRFGVDATTGEVRTTQPLSSHLNRSAYTNGYRSDLVTPVPSALLWTEGNPNSNDAQALSMYDLVVHPIQTWWPGGHAFAYDSVGVIAHYAYTNDSWHIIGTDNKSYIFAGDTRAFDDDAIAHEYGHGMYVYVGNRPQGFAPYNDWYAGNEFYGDLSAVITDIRRFGVRDASWQITNLRNWQSPGTFYNDWYPERVFANPLSPAYSNSTIYGYAVYLMIHGGVHRRAGVSTLGGTIPSIDVPAQSWLHIQKAMSHGLYLLALNNERFTAERYKARTIQAATAVFGTASGIPFTVERAWTAVGVGYNCSGPPPQPQVTVQTWYCKGTHDISWNPIANSKYHGQMVAYPWAWDSLQAQDVIDGTMTSCTQNVSGHTRLRMRACNACGCSNWTPDSWMEYWNQCQ